MSRTTQKNEAFPPTRQNFTASSTWLSSTPSAALLPNTAKLEIYGLYKYITTGQPTSSRPSIFYPTPRAKYDAWVETYKKYSALGGKGEEEGMRRYIQIAEEVGWKGEGLEEDDQEIDFDEPDVPSEALEGGEGKKSGMGPRVSTMAQQGDDILQTRDVASSSRTLHDAVVDNDLEQVKVLLRSDPDSINSTDENGNTPLHLAVDRGHAEIVRLLLLSGVDRTAKDEDDQTPLDIAQVLERTDIVALLQ